VRYIIVDLEATCWENVRDYERMETIEIGAVELLSAHESGVSCGRFWSAPLLACGIALNKDTASI
jgi:inhibitor of KinA sporulation pathway (predicted exonuclease)